MRRMKLGLILFAISTCASVASAASPADSEAALSVAILGEANAELRMAMCVDPESVDDLIAFEPMSMITTDGPPPGVTVWFRSGPQDVTTSGTYTVEFEFVDTTPADVEIGVGDCNCTGFSCYDGFSAPDDPTEQVPDIGSDGDFDATITVDGSKTQWYMVRYGSKPDWEYSPAIYLNPSGGNGGVADVIWWDKVANSETQLEQQLCTFQHLIRSGKVTHILLNGGDRGTTLSGSFKANAEAAIQAATDGGLEVIWGRRLWRFDHDTSDPLLQQTYEEALEDVHDEASTLGLSLTSLDCEPYGSIGTDGCVSAFFGRDCGSYTSCDCNTYLEVLGTIESAIDAAVTAEGPAAYALPVHADPDDGTSHYTKIWYDITTNGGSVTEHTYREIPHKYCNYYEAPSIFGAWVYTETHLGSDYPLFLPWDIIERDYLWEHGSFNGLLLYSRDEDLQAVANMIANYFDGPGVLKAYSCKDHSGIGELCVDVGCPAPCDSDGVPEPRSGGVTSMKLELTMEIESTSGITLEVVCTGATYAGTMTKRLESTPSDELYVDFSPALPDESRCTLTLSDEVSGSVSLQVLKGDTSGDGEVTNPDWLAIGSHLGDPVDETNAVFDVNLSGSITTDDRDAVIPVVGNSAPDCP